VQQDQVPPKATEIANELAAESALAIRLDRAWFREMNEEGFLRAIEAAIKAHRESYASGEPRKKWRHYVQTPRDQKPRLIT
jgi:enoyl-CoA hydratase